jgi:hypothetical protein
MNSLDFNVCRPFLWSCCRIFGQSKRLKKLDREWKSSTENEKARQRMKKLDREWKSSTENERARQRMKELDRETGKNNFRYVFKATTLYAGFDLMTHKLQSPRKNTQTLELDHTAGAFQISWAFLLKYLQFTILDPRRGKTGHVCIQMITVSSESLLTNKNNNK